MLYIYDTFIHFILITHFGFFLFTYIYISLYIYIHTFILLQLSQFQSDVLQHQYKQLKRQVILYKRESTQAQSKLESIARKRDNDALIAAEVIRQWNQVSAYIWRKREREREGGKGGNCIFVYFHIFIY